VDLIFKYFPGLDPDQINKFSALDHLYKHWNEKINVISRQDIGHLYLRHVLHSLAVAKFISFPAGSRVLDVGTGGGFPGIPLAIMFPCSSFTLVDSIGKKIRVVNEISVELDLKNVQPVHARAGDLKGDFDFVACRAVAGMPVIVKWVSHLVGKGKNNVSQKGIIALKGGDLEEELGTLNEKVRIIKVSEYFEEEYFATKKIVYLPL